MEGWEGLSHVVRSTGCQISRKQGDREGIKGRKEGRKREGGREKGGRKENIIGYTLKI